MSFFLARRALREALENAVTDPTALLVRGELGEVKFVRWLQSLANSGSFTTSLDDSGRLPFPPTYGHLAPNATRQEVELEYSEWIRAFERYVIFE